MRGLKTISCGSFISRKSPGWIERNHSDNRKSKIENRKSLGPNLLDLREGILRDENLVCDKHVSHRERLRLLFLSRRRRRSHGHVLKVAERLVSDVVVCRKDDEHSPNTIKPMSFKEFMGLLGFALGEGDRIGHGDVAGFQMSGKCRQDGDASLLLVDLLRIVARLDRQCHATVGIVRRPDRSLSGVTGLFLLVRLPASSADLASGLRLLRALALVRLFRNDCPVEGGIGRGSFRQLLAEAVLADDLAVLTLNLNCVSHLLTSPPC